MTRTLTAGEQQLVEFSKAWEQEFQGTCIIAWGGKDSKWASVLTGLMRDNELPPDEILQRRNRYFACNDEWCQSCKWNFSGFVNNIEKFGVVRRKEKSRRTAQTKPISELIIFCNDHPDQHYPADKHCPKCELKEAKR